ncbi:MAG: DNA replication/repair protein RecF [Bdellovibrionales bacterium]
MIIKNLRLKDFRNFSNLNVEFSNRLNLLIGQNGQGKSNLLEAVSLITLQDSFRYTENENLICFSKPQSIIEAQLEKNGLDFNVKMQILKSRKNILWNEKKLSSTQIQEHVSCVIFSPESLSSIKEGSDQRRQLVDQAVQSIDPLGTNLISEYRKALKTRNRILKDFLEEKSNKPRTFSLLDSLNPIFLNLCCQMTFARKKLILGLHEDFQRALRSITEQDVEISVDYLISSQNGLVLSDENISEIIRRRAVELRDAELASGTSLVGPHKHEIAFLYNQKDSRFYCSQGQQRALILSFKMAQIVYHRKVHGTYPILLLDDVLSELDANKRSSLIEFLNSIETQIFLTSTELQFSHEVEMKESRIFELKEGQVL